MRLLSQNEHGNTAIIPSYSFPVAMHSLYDIQMGSKIGHCCKKKFGMNRISPSRALIEEQAHSFR